MKENSIIREMFRRDKKYLYKFRLSDLSDCEKDKLISTMAKRLTDNMELIGESRIRDALDQLNGGEIDEDLEITICMNHLFIGNDLIEILGGIRRERRKTNEQKSDSLEEPADKESACS